jgi:hypothetical protein
MDSKEQQIRDNLKRIAKEHGPDMFFDGTVVEVDEDNYFADVQLDTGETIFECRLRAMVAGNQSIDVLPAIGSAVVIAKLLDDEYIVIAADQIDSYRVTVGSTVIKVDETGVLIQKGTETLHKLINDLIQGVLSIAAPKNVPAITALVARNNDLLK